MEGIEKAGFVAIYGKVRDGPLPGPDLESLVLVGNRIFRDVSAQEVPDQAPLYAGLRAKLQHPVLEVLDEHAGFLLEDLGAGIAPALEPAGAVKEAQEIRLGHAARPIYDQEAADVVGMVGVGQMAGGGYAREGEVDVGRGRAGVGGEGEDGEEEDEEGECGEPERPVSAGRARHGDFAHELCSPTDLVPREWAARFAAVR